MHTDLPLKIYFPPTADRLILYIDQTRRGCDIPNFGHLLRQRHRRDLLIDSVTQSELYSPHQEFLTQERVRWRLDFGCHVHDRGGRIFYQAGTWDAFLLHPWAEGRFQLRQRSAAKIEAQAP